MKERFLKWLNGKAVRYSKWYSRRDVELILNDIRNRIKFEESRVSDERYPPIPGFDYESYLNKRLVPGLKVHIETPVGWTEYVMKDKWADKVHLSMLYRSGKLKFIEDDK